MKRTVLGIDMFSLAKDLLTGILKRAPQDKPQDSRCDQDAMRENHDSEGMMNAAADALNGSPDDTPDGVSAAAVDSALSSEPSSSDHHGSASMEGAVPEDTPSAPDVGHVAGQAPDVAAAEVVVPPRRSEDDSALRATPVVTATKTRQELLSRPIPPRRPRPKSTEPDTPTPVSEKRVDEDRSEVEAVSTADFSSRVPAATYDDDQESPAETILQLRLALEASESDQGHLAAARDQAISQLAHQEQQILQLERQLQEMQRSDSTWQEEKSSLTRQVAELQATISELKVDLDTSNTRAVEMERELQGRPSAEEHQLVRDQYQATLEELRTVLGQREATEASLLRERDSLFERNADLQRDLEKLQQQQQAANPTSPDTRSSESTTSPSVELETEYPQIVAELSLANESIRQLNQNLSQRDAQLLEMRRENQSLLSQMDQPPVSEAAPDISSQLDKIEAERDRAVSDLDAATEALKASRREVEELSTQLQATNEKLEAATRDLSEMTTSREGAEEAAAEAKRLAIEGHSSLQALEHDHAELQQRLAELEGTDEELLAQIQRSQSLLAERDSAVAELKCLLEEDPVDSEPEDASEDLDLLRRHRDQAAEAAAKASETIASLMTERRSLQTEASDHAAVAQKLKVENSEYRRSVADLHATANELEELKLERAQEQDTARQRLHEATAANAELTAELASLRKQLAHESRSETQGMESKLQSLREEVAGANENLVGREAQLQRLAQQLAKARAEVSTVRSELTEQRAVVRALKRGREAGQQTTVTESNGQGPSVNSQSRSATKGKHGEAHQSPPKGRSATPAPKQQPKTKVDSSPVRPRKDAHLGMVFSSPPSNVDDLKKITGIGPAIEKRLHSVGIYHFRQIAAWSDSIVEHLDTKLSLGGRITRQDWVTQARDLSRK